MSWASGHAHDRRPHADAGDDGSELVGRQDEIRIVDRFVGDVCGTGTSLVVLGRPGTGISSVLRVGAAIGRRRGLAVVGITASPAESLLAGSGVSRLRSALGREIGEAASVFAVAPDAAPEVVATALRDIAERQPLLCVVDDAHLLDRTTRAVVDSLARRPAPGPLGVLVGGRVGRLHLPTATSMELPRLSGEEAADLLDSRGVHLKPFVRRRVLRDADGAPLALRELPLAWSSSTAIGADLFGRFSPMTDRLSEAFLRNCVPWPADTRAVLLTAALSADGDLQAVLQAAELLLGRSIAADAADHAVADGVVTLQDGRLSFPEDLTRAALVHEAGRAGVAEAHLALATVLEDRPPRRAWFLGQLAAVPDETVARELLAAAADADVRGATVEELQLLERAARLTPSPTVRVDRMLSVARLAFEMGRRDIGEDTLAAIDGLGADADQQGAAATLRARFTTPVTRQGVPIGARCRLVMRLIDEGRRDAACDVLVGITQSLIWADPDPEIRAAVLACLDALPGHENDPRFVAPLALIAPWRARVLEAALKPDERDADATRLAGVAALAVGELARAADLFTSAAGLLRASGRWGLLAQAQGALAHITIALGDWNVSTAAAEDSLALARLSGQQAWELRALAGRAVVRALRGQVADARHDAEAVETAAAGRRLGSVLASVQLARALVAVHEDEWDDAFDTLRRQFDPSDAAYSEASTHRILGYLAETALRCGRTEDAARVVRELRQHGSDSPVLAINLGFAQALLADDEHAEEAFARARAVTPPQWLWVRARIDLAYGSWLRRHRQVIDSRAPLRAALHAFDLVGAAAWSSQARKELRASGLQLEGAAPGRPATLSPQELEIATLAAQGLSNREIGLRLYLSPRTVGSHLYRIFPKLDITSRAQLPKRLTALER